MLQKECTHIEDDLPDYVLVWQIFIVEVHMSQMTHHRESRGRTVQEFLRKDRV